MTLSVEVVELDGLITMSQAVGNLHNVHPDVPPNGVLVLLPNDRLQGRVLPPNDPLKTLSENEGDTTTNPDIGVATGPAIVSDVRAILIDRHEPLIHLEALLVGKRGGDPSVYQCTIRGQSFWMNYHLSLSDVDFDPSSDLITVFPYSIFKKKIAIINKLFLLEVVKSGPLIIKRKLTGKSTPMWHVDISSKDVEFYYYTLKSRIQKMLIIRALLEYNILYLFKRTEDDHPTYAYPLDKYNVKSENEEVVLELVVSDEEASFPLLVSKKKKLKHLEDDFTLTLVSDNKTETESWYELLRLQCRNGIQSMVFGQPLTFLMKRYPNRLIPPLVTNCINYFTEEHLTEEGIFRKSGSIPELQKYIALIDRGAKLDFSDCNDPHVIASLLKRWIARLQEPLLTFSRYDAFMNCLSLKSKAPEVSVDSSEESPRVSDTEDIKAETDEIMTLCASLPAANLATLEALCSFFKQVISFSAQNKMGLENIALVIAPNLLRQRGSQIGVHSLEESRKVVRVTEILIRNCHLLANMRDSAQTKESQLEMVKKKAREENLQSTLKTSSMQSLAMPSSSSSKKRTLAGRKRSTSVVPRSSPRGTTSPTSVTASPRTPRSATAVQVPTMSLPPPPSGTRTIAELENFLAEEMQRRIALEHRLEEEIRARIRLEERFELFMGGLAVLSQSNRLQSPRKSDDEESIND